MRPTIRFLSIPFALSICIICRRNQEAFWLVRRTLALASCDHLAAYMVYTGTEESGGMKAFWLVRRTLALASCCTCRRNES